MKHHKYDEKDIVSQCYERSVQLLIDNSRSGGVIACKRSKKAAGRGYLSIFGRDASISSLGMSLCSHPQLIKSARNSLQTLANYQAPNGQIPNYVKPEINEVDFWYTGCIDATLWWLIAIDFFHRSVKNSTLKKKLSKAVDRAIRWLQCQEHQKLHLLQQNEASDWADIMPRSGFVLYTNALWYQVKKLYHLPDATLTKYFFRHIFYPFDKLPRDNRRARILTHYVEQKIRPSEFYLSYVNFSHWGTEVDVYGNILSMLFGLCPMSRCDRRVNELLKLKICEPYPVRVVNDPIPKNSPLWRTYMERYRQNHPYQYHNGGIWPFVSGFWIMLLHRLRKKKLTQRELVRFAEVNKINNWEFNEWFHGKTGRPLGMPGQSWNAAMFLLAYHCLKNGDNVF